MRTTTVALIGLLALGLTGCSRGSTHDIVVNAEAASPAAVTPAPTVAGTTTDPLRPGQSRVLVAGSAWTVALLSTNLDAAVPTTTAVPDDRRPRQDETFVVGTFSLTVSAAAVAAQGGDLATEGTSAWQSLTYSYVGADGTAYNGSTGTPCATATALIMAEPLWADGDTATGDVCVAVPSDKVEGGLWRVVNGQGTGLYFATS
ncbi:MAG: hypothetical protein KJ792_15365 [Actinobacteria bacterium]|nr:hypothetical protein [Actinomycetota bacterium]MCG2802555.1 hypothetical protein [Cellulomonas sp.]